MRPVMLLGCVALDLILGDPRGWPHPVRWLGRSIEALEPWARRAPLVRGALVTVGLAAGAALVAHALALAPVLGDVAALYLGYAGLALGSLVRETRAVRRALAAGDLEAARAGLRLLVSRDTAHLDRDGVARGLAETLAENANDAFVAPVFWLALAGVEGLWAYKAVSTLDSMWGYRTERFERLGKVAARGDDVLAFVPARLTALGMLAVAWARGRRVSLREVARQARQLESPNAGWPMAAAAHAVGAAMGGVDRYQGEIKHKPLLGPEGVPWTVDRLQELEGLVLAASVLVAVALVGVRAMS